MADRSKLLKRTGSSSPVPTSGEPSSTHPLLLAGSSSPPQQPADAPAIQPYTVSYRTRQPRAAISPSSSMTSLHPTTLPLGPSDGADPHHLRTASASSTSSAGPSLRPQTTIASGNTFSSPTTSVAKPVVIHTAASATPPSASPTASTAASGRPSSSFSLLGGGSASGVGVHFPVSGFLRPSHAASMPSSTSGIGGATEALLFQNLRGDAQSLGLDGDSFGWAIVSSLAGATAGSGTPHAPEWTALRKLLASDEDDAPKPPMVLVLPRTKLPEGQAISPAMVMDHIVVADGELVSQRNRRACSISSTGGQSEDASAGARGALMEERRIVTLSGWRGLVEGERMVLSSFGKALDIQSRPLPSPSSILPPVSPSTHLGDQLTAPPPLRYPLVTLPLSTSSTTLTVPLLIPLAPPSPTSVTRGGASTTARLASLFASHRPSSDTPRSTPIISSPNASTDSLTPAATDPATPPVSSPPATPTASQPPKTSFLVDACVVDQALPSTSDLVACVRPVLAARVRAALSDAFSTGVEVPEAAIEKAVELALRFVPCDDGFGLQDEEGGNETPIQEAGPTLFGRRKRVTSATSLTEAREGRQGSKDGPLYAAPVEELSEAVQNMYDEVRRSTGEDLLRGRGSEGAEKGGEHDQRVDDEAVDAVVELVEAVLADELYDRWFCPVGSGDAVADEAMAGRIAGLNLLDLTLDHLGLDLERAEIHDPQGVETIRAGLSDLVEAVSNELARLQDEDRRSPKDQLAVFVGLHKLIVDALGQLPKVPMKDDRKAEGEVEMSAQTSRPDEEEKSSSSSADLILPLLIYSIVRANPARLLSHLAYIKRFRAHSLVLGEAAYCLVNVDAVCEFVRSVDPASLFGGQSAGFATGDAQSDQKGGLAGVPIVSKGQRRATLTQKGSASKDKLATEVDHAFAAASRVVTGVFGGTGRILSEALDSSAKLMGAGATGDNTFQPAELAKAKPRTLDDVRQVLSGQAKDGFAKARVGLLRRATSVGAGGSPGIDSLTDDKAHRRSSGTDWTASREMHEVSPAPQPQPVEHDERESGGAGRLRAFFGRDSVGSSDGSKASGDDKPSLGDRLSSLARLNGDRGGPRPRDTSGSRLLSRPRRSTLDDIVESPATYAPERGPPPALPPRISSNAPKRAGAVDPPVARLLACHPEDLRVGDISLLLEEYKRLAAAMRDARMFSEDA